MIERAADGTLHLTVNRAGDLVFPIRLKVPTTGEYRDLTNVRMVFEVKGRLSITPALDPSDPTRRIVHITNQHAVSLGQGAREWHLLRDNGTSAVTGERLTTPILTGVITATGFASTFEAAQ